MHACMRILTANHTHCLSHASYPCHFVCLLAQSGGLFNTHGAKSRHYCVAVFDNQRGGTVIGASIMRQREVVFDITSSSISFVDANCDTITPETSHLRESYTFAPCGGGEEQVVVAASAVVTPQPLHCIAAAAAAQALTRLTMATEAATPHRGSRRRQRRLRMAPDGV